MTNAVTLSDLEASSYLLVVADRSDQGEQAMSSFCKQITGLQDVLKTWPVGADFMLLTVTADQEGVDLRHAADIAFADAPNLVTALQSIRTDQLRGRRQGVVRAAVSPDLAAAVDDALAPFRPGAIGIAPGGLVAPGHVGVVASVAGHPTTMSAFSPAQLQEIEDRLAWRLQVARDALGEKDNHAKLVVAFKAMSVEGLPEYERSYALCSLGAAIVLNHPREASAFRSVISHHLREGTIPYLNIGLDAENAISYTVGAVPGNMLEVHHHLRETGSLQSGFSGIDVAREDVPPTRLN